MSDISQFYPLNGRETTYFDPFRGWVMPGDDYVSTTYGGLKEIIATLKNIDSNGVAGPDDLYDDIERLLYKYQLFVRQGVRENIGKAHKGVSWYLADNKDNRSVINYQDGPDAEWANDLYADEVPLWLLIFLLHRIALRKPLGDQEADETIKKVDDLDASFARDKDKRDLDKNLGGLNLGGGDDE